MRTADFDQRAKDVGSPEGQPAKTKEKISSALRRRRWRAHLTTVRGIVIPIAPPLAASELSCEPACSAIHALEPSSAVLRPKDAKALWWGCFSQKGNSEHLLKQALALGRETDRFVLGHSLKRPSHAQWQRRAVSPQTTVPGPCKR
jgi:hypothetical protein